MSTILPFAQGTTATIVNAIIQRVRIVNGKWYDNPGFSSPANAAGNTDHDEAYTVDNDYYDAPGTYFPQRRFGNSKCNSPSDL